MAVTFGKKQEVTVETTDYIEAFILRKCIELHGCKYITFNILFSKSLGKVKNRGTNGYVFLKILRSSSWGRENLVIL